MARFLFATMPAVGHTLPAIPIARALVERGHQVRWYAGIAFADKIRATGARFHPITDPRWDYSELGLDGHFPRRRELKGLRQIRFDMKYGFAAPVAGQVRDILELLADEPADVLVGDTGFIGGSLIQELGGPPFAGFGISVLGFASRDLAPFGFGLAPARGRLGRARNRVLDLIVRKALFRPMTVEVNRARSSFGLAPTNASVYDFALATRLYLQFSTPGFEYSVPDLPSQVRFVGPPRPVSDPDWTPPAWWDDLARPAGGYRRKVVLVTQGTVATDADQLLRPAITALGDREDVLVIAVTGGADPATITATPPANVRLERFLPFDRLLPYVDVYLTNGGYGGVQLALAHGVPVVCAGRTEDKAEVNARVAHSGVGINLRTQTPTPDQLRDATLRILKTPDHTLAACRVRDEIATAGREQRAADLLEDLVATTRPTTTRPTTTAKPATHTPDRMNTVPGLRAADLTRSVAP